MSKRVLRQLVTRATSRAGTTRGCRRSRACAGAATRPRGSASSRRSSACPRPTASSRSASSSTPSATSSTGRRRAASRSSTRSRSSSRTTRTARSRRWRSSTTPRTRPPGPRRVPFGRELWIEREDFLEEPPPKFFRLAPGREVRLRSAYFITCTEVVKDASGRDRRAALHLRPGDARRRRPRRPATEGDAPLGVRRARRAGRGPPVRPPLRRPVPGRRRAATCSPT